MSKEWAIDFNYGIKELNQLMYNLEVTSNSSGGEMVALFREMKENNLPILLSEDKVVRLKYGQIPNDVEAGSILKLSLSGTMLTEDTLCTYGVRTLAENLYLGYKNPNIAGILLDVNSGGGEASAGTILKNAISDKNKPVVTYFNTLGSAALMGTLPSNEIIAAGESSSAGSVGTFISLNKEFIAWYKENIDDIYSSVSDDKNKPFRAYLEGDYGPIRSMVTEHAKLFQNDVSKIRELKGDEKTQLETISGGMFFAQDAKKRGLIDGIGTQNYALKRLRSHINYSK